MILAGLLSLTLVAVTTCSPPCSIFYPDYKTVDPDKGCKYYYQCNDGKLTEESCWGLTKFNPVRAECEYFNVDCKAKAKPIPGPWPQPPCYSGGPDYMTKSPRGCKFYYRCKAGTVSEEQCGTMTWFDPPTTQCIYSAKCEEPPAPIPVSTTPQTTSNGSATSITTQTTPSTTQATSNTPQTTQTTLTTASTTQTTSNGSETSITTQTTPSTTQATSNTPQTTQTTLTTPSTTQTTSNGTEQTTSGSTQSPFPVCGPNTPDYKTVCPDSCNDYYECKNGSLTLRSCGVWYNFSPSKRKCEPSWIVDCNEALVKPKWLSDVYSLLEDRRCSSSDRRPSTEGCRYYLECHSGIDVEFWCPLLHYFDTKTKKCCLWFLSDCLKKF